jgi:hypothetical protein
MRWLLARCYNTVITLLSAKHLLMMMYVLLYCRPAGAVLHENSIAATMLGLFFLLSGAFYEAPHSISTFFQQKAGA